MKCDEYEGLNQRKERNVAVVTVQINVEWQNDEDLRLRLMWEDLAD
jgi:hypothetical protein